MDCGRWCRLNCSAGQNSGSFRFSRPTSARRWRAPCSRTSCPRTRAPSLAGVAVITGDADASAMAHAAGVRVIADSDNVGTSAAVTIAAKHLEDMGHAGMLVIPADVPLITPADVETLIAAHQIAPSITLAPATADGGTNALACSPLRAIPFA